MVCDDDDVNGQELWQLQKSQLDDIIHTYKERLDRLKVHRMCGVKMGVTCLDGVVGCNHNNYNIFSP